MSYQSIDSLQNVLKNDVFSHTKDAKKLQVEPWAQWWKS